MKHRSARTFAYLVPFKNFSWLHEEVGWAFPQLSFSKLRHSFLHRVRNDAATAGEDPQRGTEYIPILTLCERNDILYTDDLFIHVRYMGLRLFLRDEPFFSGLALASIAGRWSDSMRALTRITYTSVKEVFARTCSTFPSVKTKALTVVITFSHTPGR